MNFTDEQPEQEVAQEVPAPKPNALETIATWSWVKLLLMGVGILMIVLSVYLIFAKLPVKKPEGVAS